MLVTVNGENYVPIGVAQKLRDALEAIRDVPYGDFDSKGDYAAFVRDIAETALRPTLTAQLRASAP